MELKSLMKEWRIMFLIVVLLLSTAALRPTYVSQNGDIHLKFTGLEDNLGVDFTGGTRLLLSLETNETGDDLRKLNKDVASTLRLRARQIDSIKDPKVNTVNIDGWKIRVVGNVNENQTDRSLEEIIARQGMFEARVTLPVKDSKQLDIGESYLLAKSNSTITVERQNDSVTLGTYRPGDRFSLEDYRFHYINSSEEVSNLEVRVYTGEDLASVGQVENGAKYRMTRYDWVIPVTYKTGPARDFKALMENFDTVGGDYVHEDGSSVQLKYYLDGDLQTSLGIGSIGAGVPTDRIIMIPASQQTPEGREKARLEADRIRTILKSGSLDASIRVESKTELGSSLGNEFMKVSTISIALSLVAVALLVFARYRKPKIALPLFITGSSEVFILLGLWFSTFGELTLSAVAGIIAAVGTGVDDQIIITDESGRERVRDWKKRMKTAFFVIFTSAASTIGAMVPIISPAFANLMVGLAGLGLVGYNRYSGNSNPHYFAIGVFAVLVAAVSYPLAGTGDALVSIRGFATTTIVGILIGIAITRPAYSKILEYIQG